MFLNKKSFSKVINYFYAYILRTIIKKLFFKRICVKLSVKHDMYVMLFIIITQNYY